MRVYEAIAEEFRQAGVERVFGLMGEDTAKLLIELDRIGIQFVAARHENQAVGMADGYSRVSGKLGVVFLTSGAGFTNGLTLLTTAANHGSRVIAIVGGKTWNEDTPEGAKFRSVKYYPVLPTCAAGNITAIKPRNPTETMTATRSAIVDALQGQTIVLNITYDMLESVAPAVEDLPAVQAKSVSTPKVAPEQINTVADLLQETWAVQRPVILAGEGAVRADAGPALRRLGELTGSLLISTLLARGIFSGDPYDLDVAGTFATSIGTEYLGLADTVIVFGASLNVFTTFSGHLFPQARIIQIDTNPGALGLNVEVEPELALHGDAREVAEALVAELERRDHSATGFRRPEILQRLSDFDPRSDFPDQSTADTIDPRTLMAELHEIIPKNRVVTVDPGHHASFSTRFLAAPSPQYLVWPYDAGSIGVGVGESIGATLGAGAGAVGVAAIGDGGLMMGLADIETAIRYGVPVVIVLSNDQGLGAEVHFLDMIGQSTELATHTTPDLAAVVKAMGAEGFAIRTKADLEPVRERFKRPLTGPIMLDCYVNPAIRGEWLEIVYGAKLKSSDEIAASAGGGDGRDRADRDGAPLSSGAALRSGHDQEPEANLQR
jgi:acetolactate synthase I/II/III large subunit